MKLRLSENKYNYQRFVNFLFDLNIYYHATSAIQTYHHRFLMWCYLDVTLTYYHWYGRHVAFRKQIHNSIYELYVNLTWLITNFSDIITCWGWYCTDNKELSITTPTDSWFSIIPWQGWFLILECMGFFCL